MHMQTLPYLPLGKTKISLKETTRLTFNFWVVFPILSMLLTQYIDFSPSESYSKALKWGTLFVCTNLSQTILNKRVPSISREWEVKPHSSESLTSNGCFKTVLRTKGPVSKPGTVEKKIAFLVLSEWTGLHNYIHMYMYMENTWFHKLLKITM